MVYVPAGDSKHGRQAENVDEKPVHAVYLDAYWICGKTEITRSATTSNTPKCVAMALREQKYPQKSYTHDAGNRNMTSYPVIMWWNRAVLPMGGKFTDGSWR